MENPPRCYCSGSKKGRLMKPRFVGSRSPKFYCRNGCGKTYEPPPPPPPPPEPFTALSLRSTGAYVRNSLMFGTEPVEIYWNSLGGYGFTQYSLQNVELLIADIENKTVYDVKLIKDSNQRLFYWTYNIKNWWGGEGSRSSNFLLDFSRFQKAIVSPTC